MKNHIQNIEISNFKSIKDLKIDGCKKINIFAGKPNAGKSNILEGLGILGLGINPTPFNLKDFIRFENFDDLFFEGNIFSKSLIKFNNEQLFFRIIDGKFIIQNTSGNKKLVFDLLGNENFTSEQSNFFIQPSIKKYTYKEDIYNKTSSLEFLNYPFGSNIGQTISTNVSLRNFVLKLMKENNLKLLVEKNTNKLKIFKEYEDGTVFTLPYSMIADTLQRLIFYKAAIMSNQNSVLLFEEPEAHCFEPYIMEFTNEVKFNENNNQFFMVTHSDFIIQEFLRDEESRENTQIYLVNNIDGKTEVKKLNAEKNDDVYEFGMNLFFNFDSLWENN